MLRQSNTTGNLRMPAMCGLPVGQISCGSLAAMACGPRDKPRKFASFIKVIIGNYGRR
jgi:hypothetical protein